MTIRKKRTRSACKDSVVQFHVHPRPSLLVRVLRCPGFIMATLTSTTTTTTINNNNHNSEVTNCTATDQVWVCVSWGRGYPVMILCEWCVDAGREAVSWLNSGWRSHSAPSAPSTIRLTTCLVDQLSGCQADGVCVIKCLNSVFFFYIEEWIMTSDLILSLYSWKYWSGGWLLDARG